MTWTYILLFLFSCYVLARSGAWVVKALIRIAKFLQMREFVVASFLMAFATSLPELFVGISSAIAQRPELIVGTIIGSNIIALTVMIALAALLGKDLNIKGKVVRKASFYGAAYSVLPLVLMFDSVLSKRDGLILLSSLVFYFYQLAKEEGKFRKVINSHLRGWKNFKIFVKDMFSFVFGAGILILSAEGVVFSALKLAETFNLSLMVIGAILVALGTSLPEISFEARAIMMGHKTMILGDIIGSVVINASLVLGVVALISPIYISDFSPYLIGAIFTLITCIFFQIFAKSDKKVTEKEGVILLGIYILFIISELYFR